MIKRKVKKKLYEGKNNKHSKGNQNQQRFWLVGVQFTNDKNSTKRRAGVEMEDTRRCNKKNLITSLKNNDVNNIEVFAILFLSFNELLYEVVKMSYQ